MTIYEHDPTGGCFSSQSSTQLIAVFPLMLTTVSLSFSLLVSFMDCGRGKVWMEVGDSSDFGVSGDGVVFALRRLSLVGNEEALEVIYARDQQSKQVWKTRVHLHLHPQANSTGPLQVKQKQCLHVDPLLDVTRHRNVFLL